MKLYGGIPLIIPEAKESHDLTTILNICNGFIIPGGITWNKTDEEIIKYAYMYDLPLLGICAGMQAIGNINNFCGTKESDKTIRINSIINHNDEKNDYAHKVEVQRYLLYNILKKDVIMVNSRHNYKIKNEAYFKVDATSSDGVIEAIHLPNKKFILGLQWHPEDLDDENSQKIFHKFISIASKK